MAQVPNKQLIAALARYFDHVQIIRLVTLSQRPVREDVLGRLRDIHDAFRGGDADRIASLFRDHVDAAVLAYRTYSTKPADQGRIAIAPFLDSRDTRL